MAEFKQTIPFAIALLVALSDGLQAQSVPGLPDAAPIVFNNATPPSTGRPGRRSDAGSRGCGEGDSSAISASKPLVALVPAQKTANSIVVFGKTATARPTFWFYVPYRSPATATFVLQDRSGITIHESNLPLSSKPGIISLTLPTTVEPLASGQLYQWFLKLYCRSSSPPDSFVDGWIQREVLTPDLTQKLKTATLAQQVRLYAANGFWFDALATAAELRRTNSGDSAWLELLKAIGLETVAAEAISMP